MILYHVLTRVSIPKLKILLFVILYVNRFILVIKNDISDKNAPEWAMEIDMDYIKIIKEIGNSSIHPNDGDIEIQKEIDERLLNIVDIIFSELLDKIYEQPIRSKNNLEILKNKMKILNNNE